MPEQRTQFRTPKALCCWLSVLLTLPCVAAATNAIQTAPHVPPASQLLLFVGQDSDTLSDYQQAVPEHQITGITLYTNLKAGDPQQTFTGIHRAADWQSGTVDFSASLQAFPDAALAIGLAFDQCGSEPHSSRIANGDYDRSIAWLGDYLRALAPRAIFLRIGYEFDGPWNCYHPDTYKPAFRRIVEGIRARGANNVAMIWQSAVWPDPVIAGEQQALYDHRQDQHLLRWYPGDDVVDWTAMSVFYRDLSQWQHTPVDTPQQAQQQFLAFSRRQVKPLMIAEAAPQGFRVGKLSQSPIHSNQPVPVSAEYIWQAWYQPFFDFIYANRDTIRAVAYINAHWESQGMWQCAPGSAPPAQDCRNGNWGDSRVQANPLILSRWLNEVTNPALWVQGQQHGQ